MPASTSIASSLAGRQLHGAFGIRPGARAVLELDARRRRATPAARHRPDASRAPGFTVASACVGCAGKQAQPPKRHARLQVVGVRSRSRPGRTTRPAASCPAFRHRPRFRSAPRCLSARSAAHSEIRPGPSLVTRRPGTPGPFRSALPCAIRRRRRRPAGAATAASDTNNQRPFLPGADIGAIPPLSEGLASVRKSK